MYEDPTRERGRGYYKSGAIRLTFQDSTEVKEIGDGGFTDWTATSDPEPLTDVRRPDLRRVASYGPGGRSGATEPTG